jgi:lactate racemase
MAIIFQQHMTHEPSISDSVGGLDALSLDVPDSWQVDAAAPAPLTPLDDVDAALRAAFESPVASVRLADLARPGQRVCIVSTHLTTRHLRALRTLLDQLAEAGVVTDDIVLLLAGTDNTEFDLPISQVRHDPDDIQQSNDLGTLDGLPICINYHAVEADVLLGLAELTLTDESHDGGSFEALMPGLTNRATQSELRETVWLDEQVEPSPMGSRQTRMQREAARRAGLVFTLEWIVDDAGRMVFVKAGAPGAVNEAVSATARALREATVPARYDLLVADVAANQRGSLYEASRIALRIGLDRNSALMRGGVMILPLADAEANTELSAEALSFYDALANGDTTEDVIRMLNQRSLGDGERQAWLLSHVLQRHPVIAVHPSARGPRARHVITVDSLGEATDLAETLIGHAPRALVLSHANRATPVVNLFAAGRPDDPFDSFLRDYES